MAKNPASIAFGLLEGPMARVITLARTAFADLDLLAPGREYTLLNWTDDPDGPDLVTSQAPAGMGLPAIAQAPATFNQVTFTLHAATPTGTLAEVLLVIRSRAQGVFVSLVFMGNILESLGPNWVVRLLDVLVPRLGAEAAVLCDNGDEAETERRLLAGERVSAMVLARIAGRDPLPPPLLALVRSELCDEAALEQARQHGVAVRLSLRGNVVFSTIDL
jgi:hypothetical protein